jgi:hypothetical protein
MEKQKSKGKGSDLEPGVIYRFCGNGLGIPGLPHEVTPAQAKELGLLAVLQAAVANGNYQAKGE